MALAARPRTPRGERPIWDRALGKWIRIYIPLFVFILVTLFLAGVLFTLGIGIWLARRITRPVHRLVSGACQGTRRSKQPCATTTSIHLVSPDSMFRPRLNPIEPPRYATRMPGGVGGAAP